MTPEEHIRAAVIAFCGYAHEPEAVAMEVAVNAIRAAVEEEREAIATYCETRGKCMYGDSLAPAIRARGKP